MRKSTQRGLFLIMVTVLATGVLWVIWQLPPAWRPWAAGFVLIGGPVMLFIAHILDRWQAIEAERAKRQPTTAPAPPIRLNGSKGYRPSGSFQVRQVAEKQQHRQRIV